MTIQELRHPGRWIWLLLAIPVVLGLTRLRLDVEIFNLMPQDLPAVQGLKLHQQHFANGRELLVTVTGENAEVVEERCTRIGEALRPASNLVSSVLWQAPWVENPGLASEFIAYLWYNSEENLSNLVERLRPEELPEILQDARSQLATSLSPQDIARYSYDPFGFTRLPATSEQSESIFSTGSEGFSSPDGKFRVIYIHSAQELRTYPECDAWLEQMRRQLGPFGESGNGIRVAFTGRPAFVQEIASGMRQDITLSVGGTAVIIAFLFWLAHRRVKPMLWLLTLLALTLISTMGIGGLFFGKINVVSFGFAAILLGLAVDYAVVHYQEALSHPSLTIPQVRRAIAPSITWAAVTTVAAFLTLNLGDLPGLAQLGTLVAVGVTLAGLIMVFEFLPPLFPDRSHRIGNRTRNTQTEERTASHRPAPAAPGVWRLVGSVGLLVVAVGCLALLGMPAMDPSADPLRPRHSAAYDALAEIQHHFAKSEDPIWLMTRATTNPGLRQELLRAERVLSRARENGTISDYSLPAALCINEQAQEANRARALHLAGRRDDLARAATDAGFEDEAMGLTFRILEALGAFAASPGASVPTNQMSSWIFEKFSARSTTHLYALGLIQPGQNQLAGQRKARLGQLASELNTRDTMLTGWSLLGDAIYGRVRERYAAVMVPILILVFAALWLAFRRFTEVALSVSSLALSALCVMAIMKGFHMSWNLLNLLSIPLILGTGVDYSIFMLLGLRRLNGDVDATFKTIGRALLLCAATAITGFSSLAISTNAGMASFGALCAIGIAFNMGIALFLLPSWWAWLDRRGFGPPESKPAPRKPSILYSAAAWKLGLWAVRRIPQKLLFPIARVAAGAYATVARHRTQVLVSNLLPVFRGNENSARECTGRLYSNFAAKIVDLLRYEAGCPVDDLLGEGTGWEHYPAAAKLGRGVLLVTPHLGNWEFGAPYLEAKGVGLQVVTLAEPGRDLTHLRSVARARRNVQTIVIGQDPFAFVEIIRKLDGGATVAMLIDRPPEASAAEVELFDRPLLVSIAAAEIARASGCVILPVAILREGSKYRADILPPVDYVRPELRERGARIALTQKILCAFEPLITQYPDQWYHFVPVWSDSTASSGKRKTV